MDSARVPGSHQSSKGFFKEAYAKDTCNCLLFGLMGFGFMFAMLGLSAIPVGDIRFDLKPANGDFNATFPTDQSPFPNSKKALIEFKNGAASREWGYDSTTKSFTVSQTLGTALKNFDPSRTSYKPYTPGLQIQVIGQYYLPSYEWKVVPEEMPMLWISPMWCFLTGVFVLFSSVRGARDLLLNALVFVGISASLVLIACHRVVELTYMCRTCNGMVDDYSALQKGKLGKLLDSVIDPDDFADNNCPSSLQQKCEKGTGVYLFGSVILLICMYLMFITVELRRSQLQAKPLASQDAELGRK